MKLDRDVDSGELHCRISRVRVLRGWGEEFVQIGWFDFFQGEASEMGNDAPDSGEHWNYLKTVRNEIFEELSEA